MINIRVLKKLGFKCFQYDSVKFKLVSPDNMIYSFYAFDSEEEAWEDGPNLLSYHNLQMLFNYLINYDYDITKRGQIYYVKFLFNQNASIGYDLATVICEAFLNE